MRGKVLPSPQILSDYRITPAYAGKREHVFERVLCCMGSPPPMRGKGKSFRGRRSTTKDHPRLCGEKC